MNDKKTASKGITFVELLQVAFIVLKLCGVISWSWFVVLIPMIISAFVFIVILITILIMS